MQFDGMKSVVFAGQKFNQVGEPAADTDPDYSGWTRYTYQGEANNDIYPEGNLSQPLIIRVKKGGDLKTGDTVQVQIPASLIPTRYFDVDATAGTMSVTDAYPIRIFYGVSLKGGVADSIAAGVPMSGLSQAEYDELATYVRSNQYTKGDTAYASFLSNAWTGGANGNTTSSFEPSSGNEFYYFTKPTTLYSDAACERPVTSRSQIQDDKPTITRTPSGSSQTRRQIQTARRMQPKRRSRPSRLLLRRRASSQRAQTVMATCASPVARVTRR